MASNHKVNEIDDGNRTPTKLQQVQATFINEFDLIKDVAAQLTEYYN